VASLESIVENPAMFEQQLTRAVDIAMAVITAYGFKVIGALVILIVGWILAGIVQNAILKAGKRTQRIDVTIFTFAASMARYAVLVFTIIATLSSFGVETTSFVAVLGAMGLAVGLALQGALGHVASGLMLILLRPFRVGDAIEAAGVTGTVVEISLFTTEIATVDNIKIVIPNSAIFSGVIRNFSGHLTRRMSIEVGISYDADADEAVAIVQSLMKDDVRINNSPPPLVAVSRFTDTSVVLLAQAWVARGDLLTTKFDLTKQIKRAFSEKGIAGPSLSRQVYMEQPNPPPP
jgi:small conductance mechanosensitive channel